MSDELIEAMARCLHDTSFPEGHVARVGKWTGSKKYWLRLARALIPVIRAHLEPTSEMVVAVRHSTTWYGFVPENKDIKKMVRAMLAASPIGDVG